ncbi:hypothetical protein [Geothrix sp. PMB-07]|uniref:hypothetical protein n=1 Tax=Geothrix sp. PMB-07 TaxID=3068640 RepID=UPI0027403470|nr:hypothetical protein [Geothrix sp. PMB-07]WLT32997.1 hypothetical protein Q9293_06625 [Geothrix sp. PMB-07]
MRRLAFLSLAACGLVSAQGSGLDEGRLDPVWFGSAVVFQPSKDLGFQWLKPGLDLQKRSLRLKAWEPTAWLLGKRGTQDQLFLLRVERSLQSDLDKRLRRGLKGALPVSTAAGDVTLIGRVVDAVGAAEDSMVPGTMTLSFDVKLVDGDSGDLLGAFHTTLSGPGTEAVMGQYWRWCEDLGRLLAKQVPAPAAAKPVAAPPPASVPPAFDLEGALRRIEGLKRDGLLSEEECAVLRKKAAAKAK